MWTKEAFFACNNMHNKQSIPFWSLKNPRCAVVRHQTRWSINHPTGADPTRTLVSLDRSGDKRLVRTSGLFPLCGHSPSLKKFDTVLRGVSLLRQTGSINGHTMGLRLVHYADNHTSVESQTPNNGQCSQSHVLCLQPTNEQPAFYMSN
ncbi:hypothetical protein TNCV_3281431 [Trichonephila clavipes]|nr:hypothetical protein TNCV_3281431 [Trichonephila clavipes]